MTRMTGPDCVVMCNLINTYIHTYIHTCIHTYIHTYIHAYIRTIYYRAQRKRRDHRMTSYNRAFEIIQCESIETTLRTRRRFWAGAFIRFSGGRQPKRIVFGNLEGAVRRERGGKEKEWTDCIESDVWAFGIAGIGTQRY